MKALPGPGIGDKFGMVWFGGPQLCYTYIVWHVHAYLPIYLLRMSGRVEEGGCPASPIGRCLMP